MPELKSKQIKFVLSMRVATLPLKNPSHRRAGGLWGRG
jgi:hypothetical protein